MKIYSVSNVKKLPFRQALLSMNCGCLLGFVIGKTKTANRSHCLQLFYKQNLACWILQSIYNTVRGESENSHKSPLFSEQISPVASPDLLKGTASWLNLPRLAVSGPRLGWHEWSRLSGDPITPVPKLRFDSFSAALSAAVSGAGVMLASLPLCSPLLDQGKLVRVSEHLLDPQETYWMLAKKDRLSKSQWKNLVEVFTVR